MGSLRYFFANSWLNGAQQKAYAGGTTKVAVAAAPLAYGSDITPDKVRFVDYPNTSIPPGAFTDNVKLLPPGKKRVALMPISVNEPILADKISAEGQGASIAALLPEGMRAASVRINDVSGVAGFVQPNDSVDVLITRQLPGADGNQQVTDVLLQNVRVIAIDQQAKNADGSPKVAKTATLEVAPLDAQKLALAQQIGDLSLVLQQAGRAEQSGRRDGQPQRPPLQHVRRRALSGAGGGRLLRERAWRRHGRGDDAHGERDLIGVRSAPGAALYRRQEGRGLQQRPSKFRCGTELRASRWR